MPRCSQLGQIWNWRIKHIKDALKGLSLSILLLYHPYHAGSVLNLFPLELQGGCCGSSHHKQTQQDQQWELRLLLLTPASNWP